MNNENTSVQPKLMDYYVQNPDEFVEKFQNARVPLKNSDILLLEKSSQYFKFDVDFHPENFSKDISANLLEIQEYLQFGPWKQEFSVILRFRKCPNTEGTILLDYRLEFDWNLSEQIQELTAKVNLSMENREDVPEELRWNEFNFNFAEYGRFYHQRLFKDTISVESGRSSDVKKLWTTETNILTKFTFNIRLSDNFLFKKRFQEDIGWLDLIENSNGNFIEITTDSPNSKVFLVDKSILASISPVFEAMLKNPKNKEVQENKLIFKGEKSTVVSSFCHLLDQSHFPDFTCFFTDSEKNLALLLLIFADKYDIKYLYKNCLEFIIKKLLDKNSLEILKVSNIVNDEILFGKAMKYFLASRDNNIRQCLLKHPEMISEMIDSVEL